MILRYLAITDLRKRTYRAGPPKTIGKRAKTNGLILSGFD